LQAEVDIKKSATHNKTSRMKHTYILPQALLSLLFFLLYVGCSSPSAVLKLDSPEETLLEPAPVDPVKIAYLDSLSRAHALERQQAIATLIRLKEKEQRKSKAFKLARVKFLSELAEKQHQEKSEELAATLTEAIELIAELLEHEELERDFNFCWMAFRILQLYDEHVLPLAKLDTDNPALAIRERLLCNPEQMSVDENLFAGMLLPKTQIPLVLNAEVKKFITYFSTFPKVKEIFQRYLHRAALYFPTIERVIAEEGAPPELIYLSIIESGVNPHARSRANAVGMWQFIKETGRLYGLAGNKWFDERRDIIKSTRSAMRHLKDLYQLYGDWYLALAAYNAGSGRVNRALYKSPHQRDFWALRKYFRRETQQYVPRYIAATIIALYPERFGFEPIRFAKPIEYDEVIVPDCITLPTLAAYSGIDVDTLQFLNPELFKNMTPPAYKGYVLRVPKGRGADMAAAIEKIPAGERLYFIAHKAKREESLLALAKQYKVSADVLKQFNELKTWAVPKGSVVMIPTTSEVFQTVSYALSDLSDDSREVRYRARYRKRYALRKRHKKGRSTAAISLPASASIC